MQTLNYHDHYVWKIIETKNKALISCSDDSSIIFYLKDNNEYKKDYQISTNGSCLTIIQTKDNEICYLEDKKRICFYDIFERKKINASISIVDNYDEYRLWFIMIK